MPIKYKDLIFDVVEFIEEEKSFYLHDERKKYSIKFPYIPKIPDERYIEYDYEIFLFENNSLNAENDVFQLFDKEKDTRIGWIFPITILESNENDFADNIHLNRYKFVTYKKLLLLNEKINDNSNLDNDFNLSDIFGENTIICILYKGNIKDDFSINSYYPNFAIYGYFEKNDYPLLVKNKFLDEIITNNFRGKIKLYLRGAKNCNFVKQDFIKNLYKYYLKTSEHHLIKFHILYQIIEYLIEEKFENEFDKLLENYKKNQLTKNNFIEEINNIRKERENIKKIINQINFTSDFEKDIKNTLESSIKDFLSTFNIEKNNLGDLIYDIRNLITHNYRKIDEENKKLLKEIVSLFELLINFIIIKKS